MEIGTILGELEPNDLARKRKEKQRKGAQQDVHKWQRVPELVQESETNSGLGYEQAVGSSEEKRVGC